MNLKKIYEKLISEKKKMSWFYSGEKRKSLSIVWWFGGEKEKKNISAPFSSFYSKGKKMSLRFLTLVAPLGTLHSFISFSFLMDDESILCLSLASYFHLFLFRHFGWKGDGGQGKSCSLICAILSAFLRFQFNSPIHSFLSSPLCQRCISPFCGFSMF